MGNPGTRGRPVGAGIGLQHASWAVVGLCLLNIIFASAMSGIVSNELDTDSACLLNTKGNVCTFTYVTTGAIILFAISVSLPIILVSLKRRWAAAPLIGIYLSIGLFSLIWQLVMCITITIRGNQATDEGLPEASARTSTVGFAWTGFVVTLLMCLVILADLIMQKRHISEPLLSDASSEGTDNSTVEDAAFKAV